jgi:type II secretion system protein H
MRGFTLLELLVTIAVLGVLSSIAALGWRTTRATDAQRLADSLAIARGAAIADGRPVSLRLGRATVRFFPDGSSSGGRFRRGDVVVEVAPLSGAIRAR